MALMTVLCLLLAACAGTQVAPTTEAPVTGAELTAPAVQVPTAIAPAVASVTAEISPIETVTFTVPAATLATLQSATYTIDGQPYALVDGKYENIEQRTTVVLSPPAATGDLNGDGQDDAAALLYQNTGGSGTFGWLAAMVDVGGTLTNTDTIFLGDRVGVNAMTIENGEVSLDVITHGPNDPMCCPTLNAQWSYKLVDGKWELTSPGGPPTLEP
jgi:hypothetical protein